MCAVKSKKTSQTVLDFKDSELASSVRSSTTFLDNLKLPVHRWFRYSAGYSAEWVYAEILKYKSKCVFDPFVGSGTTLLAADAAGIKSFGTEAQPFVYKIAESKTSWDVDFKQFRMEAESLFLKSLKMDINALDIHSLLPRCYSQENLDSLIRLRIAFSKTKTEEPIRKLLWLLITSILRSTSNVGTAQWQYLLPNREKKNTSTVEIAFNKKLSEMANDIELFQSRGLTRKSEVVLHDIQTSIKSYKNKADLLITSPPYPNNYDYADATRLEMAYWGELTDWGNLHEIARKNLLCSCSQHSSAEKLVLEEILINPLLDPIRDELKKVCDELAIVRLTKGGKKSYHTMIAGYYLGIAKVINSCREVMKSNSNGCFVIGDSAPYGIYAPADQWMEKLLVNSGFDHVSFIKTRDRNIKWKNRKHTVPLKEGRLWFKG